MRPLEKNKTYPAVIEGYSSEGMGIARINGQVVFVSGAIRGEEGDVLILKVLKNAAFGKMVSRRVTSAHRREPDCPYYTRCGGCVYRHMDYAEELFAKRQRVQDALCRLGGSDVAVEEILGAAHTLRYRNKSQYPVSPEGAVGFYRARTHQVTDIDRCLIQKEQADAAAGALRRYMQECGVAGYDEKTGGGLVRHLYVRTNQAGESLICVLVNGKKLPCEQKLVELLRQAAPSAVGVLLGVNTTRGNVILGERYRALWGDAALTDTLCGHRFRLSVPSFYQVNREQAEVLYRRAVDYAGLTGQELVLDLYCGAGTITLTMADRARKVIGAEIVAPAVENARENARLNGVQNAEFLCADAGQAAAELARKGLRPDVICADPPRKGLAPEVIEAIGQMAPQRVVYVSCDPATLGRDIKLFAALGYQALRATAVDMFPGTAHVETVVLLSKGEVDSKKIRVEFSLEDMDMSEFQDGATYTQIKDYVLEHTGLKVSSLYISQIKRKCGIGVGKNYNLPKSEDSRQPQCPPEKEKAIREAFKYFGMI